MTRQFVRSACLGLLFAAAALTQSADGAPGAVRARNDVVCKLRIRGGATMAAGAAAEVAVVARNKSRRRAQTIALAIYADAPSGTPLWTETVRVGARGRRSRRVMVNVPPTATSLIAVAECEADDNPGNNLWSVPVVGGIPPGPDGDPEEPQVDPAVLAGAATFSYHCAICHAPDGTGSSSGPFIVGRTADDIYSAFRTGPGRMPMFLSLTRTDAENVAKFLEDTGAVLKTAPRAPLSRAAAR